MLRLTLIAIVTISFVVPNSGSAQESLPWVAQDGMYWVDEEGKKVDLKGVNLGNWLILEMWMTSLFADVQDQCDLESQLTARFGYAGKESVMKTWRDHWITERDLDICQSLGFNCIRVPFLYSIIEDENQPFTLRPDAWQYLDWVIDEAEQRGIYTILDLHGAVGGQSTMDHTGCSNQNQLWGNAVYQQRTVWLWQQIAQRYENRSVVAAYDLINEAWGTDCNTMADFQIALYDAVRLYDQNHIVLLSSAISCGGIDMYGDPQDDLGMFNVAFTHHFYPGFFGNGDATVATHADWLSCLGGGNSGICEWANKMANTGTAFLVGEFQPWAAQGANGPQLTRHTFDRYAELGMATTAWAYKVLTPDGGQGQGTWGVVTNIGGQPAITASTWGCPGWNTTFDDACGARSARFTAPGTGPQTIYLVLKNGALNTNTFDVVWDEISLVHETTGNEIITNGSFGSADGWLSYVHEFPVSRDFNFQNISPIGGSGPALRMTGTAPSFRIANGGVYQAVNLIGGETYTLSGSFRDLGSNDAWAEVFLVDTPPLFGVDLVNQDRLPTIDLTTWSQAEIEAYLSTLSSMEYDLDPELANWFTTDAQPCSITQLCEETAFPFDGTPQLIPGRIEAEEYDLGGERQGYHDCDTSNNGGAFRAGEGVDIEVCSEGGFNIGWLCPNEWIDYQVDVSQSGTYQIDTRVASLQSGGRYFLESSVGNRTPIVNISATGGWQSWDTVSTTINLPVGVQQMRFYNAGESGQEFNVNYFEFSLTSPFFDIDGDGVFNGADIDAFVAVLLGTSEIPNHLVNADVNNDGLVDARDLGVMIENL